MIQWLFCHILRHKRVYEVVIPGEYTDRVFYDDRTKQIITIKDQVYKYENSSFCLRCGKQFKKINRN